jgi:glycosyltransferase involved in cell wall biosynthesis
LGNLHLAGGLWTALRMTDLVTLRHNAFRELMRQADRVISLCSWVSELLRTNGVPPEKIELCRHGLPTPDWSAPPDTKARSAGSGCRLVFLGRIHPTKGLEQLLKAIAAAPELKLTLDIYGITQSAAEVAYREKLLALCDSRVRWLKPVASRDVVRCLAEYDALAVPSQWLETGPLVVLEAFAAGIPVVGSDLGGIGELVRHEIDGLLVPAESVAAWGQALTRLSEEPGLLDRLQAGIRPPRTMRSVAAQMLDLYERLTTQRQFTSATAFI